MHVLLGVSRSPYIGPHLQGRRVDFVELVEVAVDDGVLRKAILGAGGHHDGARYLLSSGCFVVDLNRTRHMALQRHTSLAHPWTVGNWYFLGVQRSRQSLVNFFYSQPRSVHVCATNRA